MYMNIKFSRIWSMPNSNTFCIKPIKELIQKYINVVGGAWIDPFVGDSIFKSNMLITNDLNPNKDALSFLNRIETSSVDGLLYDPPYSVRQVAECYKSVGINVTSEMTRSDFYTKIKKEISRIIKIGGVVITFGWNSGGVGVKLGFNIEEILLVPHGGIHNDTIVTVSRKV